MKPSIDQWLEEAKTLESHTENGMYLVHNGTVRKTEKAYARSFQDTTKEVVEMKFSYNKELLEEIISEARETEGIHLVRVWLNEGLLQVGDDIMYVLIGGSIRPVVLGTFEHIMDRIKGECVIEEEITK